MEAHAPCDGHGLVLGHRTPGPDSVMGLLRYRLYPGSDRPEASGGSAPQLYRTQ